MKAHDVFQTAGWIAGSIFGRFFPQQALRVLQGRDFNAALGRVDDALAVAEEQVEVWEPGQSPMEQAQAKINSSIAMAMGQPSDFTDCTGPCAQAADLDDHRPACAARAADSPAADERIPDQRPAAGRTSRCSCKTAPHNYCGEHGAGPLPGLPDERAGAQPNSDPRVFDRDAYMAGLTWPEPTPKLDRDDQVDHVSAIVRSVGVHPIEALTAARRIVDMLAADKRIAERLDGAK